MTREIDLELLLDASSSDVSTASFTDTLASAGHVAGAASTAINASLAHPDDDIAMPSVQQCEISPLLGASPVLSSSHAHRLLESAYYQAKRAGSVADFENIIRIIDEDHCHDSDALTILRCKALRFVLEGRLREAMYNEAVAVVAEITRAPLPRVQMQRAVEAILDLIDKYRDASSLPSVVFEEVALLPVMQRLHSGKEPAALMQLSLYISTDKLVAAQKLAADIEGVFAGLAEWWVWKTRRLLCLYTMLVRMYTKLADPLCIIALGEKVKALKSPDTEAAHAIMIEAGRAQWRLRQYAAARNTFMQLNQRQLAGLCDPKWYSLDPPVPVEEVVSLDHHQQGQCDKDQLEIVRYICELQQIGRLRAELGKMEGVRREVSFDELSCSDEATIAKAIAHSPLVLKVRIDQPRRQLVFCSFFAQTPQ